jgi:3-deoxy-manno-octulosonate cytidylyltransferase (CMP-KDO synthetase)
MKTAIIIPARWGSTRFPGKPLVKIGGVPMLQRVVEIGKASAANFDDTIVMVATEDVRIQEFCAQINVPCAMTPNDCPTGSDRVLAALKAENIEADFVFGLQGDAPFTPLDAIAKMIEFVRAAPKTEVITPIVRLRWDELVALRQSKTQTPFSGTTAIINDAGKAIWFSKNIIPAIRKEDQLCTKSEFSPVYQHLGLYGFRRDILETFVALPQGHYETLEGLEQLRLLENGISIQTITLSIAAGLAQAGIDSPEDVSRAEKILNGTQSI